MEFRFDRTFSSISTGRPLKSSLKRLEKSTFFIKKYAKSCRKVWWFTNFKSNLHWTNATNITNWKIKISWSSQVQIWKYLWRGFVSDHALFYNLFKLEFEGLPVEIEKNVRSKENSDRWDMFKNGHSHDFSAIRKNPRIYLKTIIIKGLNSWYLQFYQGYTTMLTVDFFLINLTNNINSFPGHYRLLQIHRKWPSTSKSILNSQNTIW